MSKEKLEHFWITELTRPRFEEWLENEPEPVIIIGVGSIEQHGPHLPLGTDSITIRKVIHEVAKRTNSVCVQPCWPGFSPHHMGFKGTITFSGNTLQNVLLDTISSLAEHGLKRFVILNGHGGNTDIINQVVRDAREKLNVMVATPSGPKNTKLRKKAAERQKRFWDIHAGVGETGTGLFLFPDLVEMWRLDNWVPTLKLDPKLMEFLDPNREDYELVSQVFAGSKQRKVEDWTLSGVYGKVDPREGSADEASILFEERVQFVANFINLWKTIPLPKSYKEI